MSSAVRVLEACEGGTARVGQGSFRLPPPKSMPICQMLGTNRTGFAALSSTEIGCPVLRSGMLLPGHGSREGVLHAEKGPLSTTQKEREVESEGARGKDREGGTSCEGEKTRERGEEGEGRRKKEGEEREERCKASDKDLDIKTRGLSRLGATLGDFGDHGHNFEHALLSMDFKTLCNAGQI
eukprot:1059792-Rhodomonas_salina.1